MKKYIDNLKTLKTHFNLKVPENMIDMASFGRLSNDIPRCIIGHSITCPGLEPLEEEIYSVGSEEFVNLSCYCYRLFGIHANTNKMIHASQSSTRENVLNLIDDRIEHLEFISNN